MTYPKRPLATLPLFILSSAVCHMAHADDLTLSEDVTTMRYQEESSQWVPESVTVIGQDEIESTFRRTLEDLEGYVPGLIIDPVANSPRGAAMGIRGISSVPISKGIEPAVAVTIDGVYVGSHATSNQVLFDFERVEVARGPQGTFTGAPAQAGAIHLVRTKPTGELGLRTRISFDDFDRHDADAVFNFGLSDQVAAKISASFYERNDSDVTNGTNGRDENREDRAAFSTSLLYTPMETLEVQYTLDIEGDDSTTPALLNFSDTGDLVCVPDPTDTDTTANCRSSSNVLFPEGNEPEQTLQNYSNNREFDGVYHTLTATYDFNGQIIKGISGWRRTEEAYAIDYDGTSVDAFSSNIDQDYDQFTTEVTISGMATENLRYVVGGYFMDSDYDLTRSDLFVLDTINNAGVLSPALTAGLSRDLTTRQEAFYRAGFLHFDYTYDQQWNFDLGLRVTRTQKKFYHQASGATTLAVEADDERKPVSGSAGFRYKVDELAMIYGRISVDNNPVGFYDQAITTYNAQPYDVSKTSMAEIGMKSDWMDGKLRLNFSLHQTNQDDALELYAGRAPDGTIQARLDNIAEIKTNGIDLEFEYAATPNLYFRGAMTHLAAHYESYVVPDLENPGEFLNLEPKVERAPSETYYLGANYQFPFWDGLVKAYLGYEHYKQYWANNAKDTGLIRPFTLLDTSIEYHWKDVIFRLFSENLKDKRTRTQTYTFFDAQFAPLPATATGINGISTVTTLNPSRYTGVEIIWQPEF